MTHRTAPAPMSARRPVAWRSHRTPARPSHHFHAKRRDQVPAEARTLPERLSPGATGTGGIFSFRRATQTT